ncbi:MAG: hypothetical protein KDD69_13720 [Bdellovibrionales bacterium]|nr:hypothetical protein [Bdellovibrionales bacterium]
MSRKRSARPRLVDRDFDIFEHIMRYRMTTREVLQRLFFTDSELNAVTKVTSRLVEHGFLRRYELYPSRSYFTLGPASRHFLGIRQNATRDLGPIAKAREFAVLCYCCLSDKVRERLTVSELNTKLPGFALGGLDNSHYYLDRHGDTTRLTYMRVDLGGSIDHILRKCRKDVADRMRYDVFDDLISNDRFALAIVTARSEKVQKIRDALEQQLDWPIAFRIEAVPELVELVTHLFDDAS